MVVYLGKRKWYKINDKLKGIDRWVNILLKVFCNLVIDFLNLFCIFVSLGIVFNLLWNKNSYDLKSIVILDEEFLFNLVKNFYK